MAQQPRKLGDVGGDAPGLIAGQYVCRRSPSRLLLEVHANQELTNLSGGGRLCLDFVIVLLGLARNGAAIRTGGFNMNRFFPLISCAFVGILVSSCAQNPHRVVSKPAYGSASGTPHRPAKRHHVALAQVSLRHLPQRAASEGHRRLLRPWNHLRAAPETPAPANAPTPPHTDYLLAAPETPATANATTPAHTDHLPAAPEIPATPKGFEIRSPAYWRWQ